MVERKDKVMVRKERMNMNYNMENIEYRLNQAERQEDEREKIGTSRKIAVSPSKSHGSTVYQQEIR